MRTALQFVATSAMALACPAWAAAATDLVMDAAREVRRAGCNGHPGTDADLHRDPKLDAVAKRWADQGGGWLKIAFESELVPARQRASLSISRATNDQIMDSLRDRLCDELTDPQWTRLGSYSGGGTLWVVLTVPSEAPEPGPPSEVNDRALVLVNAIRARGARCGSTVFAKAPPLRMNDALIRAAKMHAEEMARFRYLAHEGRNGSTPAERATNAGYAWRLNGENVAAGPESATEVVRGWEESPAHCENLMNAQYTEMGLAFGTNPQPTGHSTWWSQVFGRPK